MARLRPFFCGNWKLFGTLSESVALATGVRDGTAGIEGCDVGVAPGFVALATVADKLKGSHVLVSSQDATWEEKGAFTGEVSVGQIADAGARCVIVGHSERRALYGETDEQVAKKVRAVLKGGLTPILCIGESLAERDANKTLNVVGTQLEAAVKGLAGAELARVVVAYEPVWAIGTGRNATPDQAVEVHRFIRSRLLEVGGGSGQEVRILYGGSVKPDNVASLLARPEIDGALVGGASLTVDGFVRLVKEGTAACSRS